VRLAVVGGGIAGLAAAWEGLQQGADVVVLEASERLGGKIRTERADGRVVEHGPDSFVAYRPAALALIRELGLEEDVISTRGTRKVFLHSRGRMHPLPDGMGMVLRPGCGRSSRRGRSRRGTSCALDSTLSFRGCWATTMSRSEPSSVDAWAAGSSASSPIR